MARITGFGESYDDGSQRIPFGGGANYEESNLGDAQDYQRKAAREDESLGARRRIDHGHHGPSEEYQAIPHSSRLLRPATPRPESDPFKEQYRRKTED